MMARDIWMIWTELDDIRPRPGQRSMDLASQRLPSPTAAVMSLKMNEGCRTDEEAERYLDDIDRTRL